MAVELVLKEIEGGLTSVQGITAAGLHAGIKTEGLDLGLIVSNPAAEAAGLFTTNLFKAAPVRWCEARVSHNPISAILVNSGNANACMGEQGLKDVEAIAAVLAASLNVPPDSLLMASTGVIGKPLPSEKVIKAIPQLVAQLSDKGGQDVARAIMTTDTFAKEIAIEYQMKNRRIRVAGITKGAGMINPSMATMLTFMVTDAPVPEDLLRGMLREAVGKSFHMITVDGDTSTNDTVICLANGLAGGKPIKAESEEARYFAKAIEHVCLKLAQMIVKDGEGATKFVEIFVTGAESSQEAKVIAKAIANSPLVKTAFFGKDPNWGRILSAAGSCGVLFNPDAVELYIGDVKVFRQGGPVGGAWEAEARRVMAEKEFKITLCLTQGKASASVWTCDLSYDYVKINAAYST